MLIEAEKKAYKDKMEELLGTVRTLEQEAIDNHIQIENLKAVCLFILDFESHNYFKFHSGT